MRNVAVPTRDSPEASGAPSPEESGTSGWVMLGWWPHSWGAVDGRVSRPGVGGSGWVRLAPPKVSGAQGPECSELSGMVWPQLKLAGEAGWSRGGGWAGGGVAGNAEWSDKDSGTPRGGAVSSKSVVRVGLDGWVSSIGLSTTKSS